MSDVAVKQNTAVATTGHDPYASYGAQQQDGTFLSFSRVGEFEAGQDKEQVPFGTRLVANMPGLRQGWRCWIGGKMVDDRTDLLGLPQPRRNEMGDMDPGLWEIGKDGKPRDPWAMTDLLELSDGETNYIFSATSKGGRGAIQKLCATYAKERRMRPDMLPIVELRRDSYEHKAFGKTYFPVFEIVGWTDQNNPSVDGSEDTGELPDGERVTGQRAANPTQGAANASVTRSADAASNSKTRSRSEPAGSKPTRF